MGPLTFCSTCGAELAVASKIISEYKKSKLTNINLEEINTYDERQLLKNTLGGLMDEMKLDFCCRVMINSYVDITSQVYN